MTQKPIMSRIFKPAIARSGNAQNGWSIFVQASPQATAIAVLAVLVPISSAAGIHYTHLPSANDSLQMERVLPRGLVKFMIWRDES